MQFGEDSDDKYFFSQPHQPFFVLAFVNAILLMLLFMLAYKGSIHIAINPVLFHAYGIVFLVFTPAFLAFLFTTFPRFASTKVIHKKTYMRTFGLFYLGSILFVLGSIASPVFSAIGMLFLLAGHIDGTLILRNIYLTTKMEDKQDIFWILTAMEFGILSHVLVIIGQLFYAQHFYAQLFSLGEEIGIYLYLFLLVFSVAQRMVPFFSHCIVEKNENLLKTVFVLLLVHVILEGIHTNASFIIDLILAAVLGREILRWKLPFPNENPMLNILHIALYWVPLAFLIGGLANLVTLLTGISFLALDLHVLTLGFIFTILIGFGTRVTLGHSGNMMQADIWTKSLFYATPVLVLLRVLISLAAAFGIDFMVLFDITATVWILLLGVWAYRFFPVLIAGKKLS